MRASRFLLAVPLLAAVVFTSSAAHAQGSGGTSGTGTMPSSDNLLNLTKDDFEITIWRKDGGKWVPLNDLDLKTFFNRARCDCKTPIKLRVLGKQTARSKIAQGHTADVKLRVGGSGCSQPETTTPKPYCNDVPNSSVGEISQLLNPGLEVETTVDVLFARSIMPTGNESNFDCTQEVSQSLWLWIDVDKHGAPDFTDGKIDFTIDGKPPSVPADFRVRGGQEALEVDWTVTTPDPDLDGFVVFCSRGGDTPVFKPGSFNAPYSSVGSVCGQAPAALTTALAPLADEVPATGQRGSSPLQFRLLDPNFVCSDRLARTQTGYRIKILQNGIPYLVGVAAIDKTGNASPIDEVLLQIPIPTRDFYRGYRAAGGEAEGGCALGRQGGRARWAPFAAAPALALWLWRRRRVRRAS